MIRKLVASAFLAFAVSAAAAPAVVHTNGDAHSRALAKIFFPEAPVLASPGADGMLVWKRLDGNKTDVAIQIALAVHYQPSLPGREDYATTHDLLATLATTRQLLMVRAESPIKRLEDARLLGRPATVGWNGHACESLSRPAFAKAGVEMVYVSYKTPQEAVAAMLGGHIDFACPAAASMQHLLDAGTARPILDLTGLHEFALTTQVFVSRDMPPETRTKILALINRPLTADDHAIAGRNGFSLFVRTGGDAQKIFRHDRAAWKRILTNSSGP